MSKSKPLLIVLAVALLAGCATGVKRPLPGCSETAERRPLNPSHWPLKPPAVTPAAPAQDKHPAPTVGPAGQTPAGPTAGGQDHPGGIAPPPTAIPAAQEPSTPKPPWWRRLWGAARSATPTWECEVRRHE
jgi:hypothetical protein